MSTVLIDKEATISDINRHIANQLVGIPGLIIDLENHRHQYFSPNYPPEFGAIIAEVYNRKGFIRSVPPVPGAILAVREMQFRGHEVMVCTSPLLGNPYWEEETLAWIKEHFGNLEVRIGPDKTIVPGDILIDDKPKITGSRTPKWQQIIFDQPYNRSVDPKIPRLRHWVDWPTVLAPFI